MSGIWKSWTHGSHITVLFVLMAATRDGQKEDDDPGNANLRPHFQVNRTNTRVEAGTHEDIVYETPRHANLVSTRDGDKVDTKGHRKPIYDRHRHYMTIVIDDVSQAEDVKVMKDGSGDHGGVDRPESIAVVHKSFVAE